MKKVTKPAPASTRDPGKVRIGEGNIRSDLKPLSEVRDSGKVRSE